MTSPVVAFAGMTHLGLVSATAVAAVGFYTICFDPDEALIHRLKRGELPILEPHLPEAIVANGPRQVFTSSIGDIGRCDVVYVAPDIVTNDAGRSDTSNLRALIDLIAPAMQPTAVLVVLSQVEPGFTRALAAPPLERRYYQVETLVFGRALERASKPERYIVGCADPTRPLDPRFSAVLKAFNCPILPMRYESAELAKISINMCLVASIGVANTMAELCEEIGADWSEIIPALKLDRRIGQYSYLSPGLGIAGGNLERDLATVIRLAGEYGTDSGIVQAWIANSRHCRDWAVRTLRRAVLTIRKNPLIAVWGLAYKENTHSVKNSPSLATLRQLPEVRFQVHDPAVHLAPAEYPRAVTAGNPLATLAGADALMILTPWPEYRDIVPAQIAATMPGKLVIDPYRVLDPNQAHLAGLTYFTLGAPSIQRGA